MNMEIWFSDLREEAQKKVLEALGLKSPEEGNLDVIPLFVLETEAETETLSRCKVCGEEYYEDELVEGACYVCREVQNG